MTDETVRLPGCEAVSEELRRALHVFMATTWESIKPNFEFIARVMEQVGEQQGQREEADQVMEEQVPVREQTLATAAALISGQRAKDYGDARESFTRLSQLWSPVLGVDVTPEQVALCLAQLKISRLVVTPSHADSWVDAAGYIALGSEIAVS